MSNIYATYSRNGEDIRKYRLHRVELFYEILEITIIFPKNIHIYKKKKNHLLVQPIRRKSAKFLYETETN